MGGIRASPAAAQRSEVAHPARHLLGRLKKGAPVVLSTALWSCERVQAAIQRGPHKSANEHVEFLHQEFAAMLGKGQWTMLPADMVEHLQKLRVSPLGVVHQRERRPRTICNYSFYNVNAETVPVAPNESMQFGRALHRIISRIVHADPRYGPVYMAKWDLADGYYRIWLLPEDIPKLGLSYPTTKGSPNMNAFPLALPMGWISSPPFFCAVTDIANATMRDCHLAPSHRLETMADSEPSAKTLPTVTNTDPMILPPPTAHHTQIKHCMPMAYVDVYVDDFIGQAQGNAKRRKNVQRVLLHSLDQVMRRLDGNDHPFRQEPASVKKMLKGDASWQTRKVVLGWVLDTIAYTLELPPHRRERLFAILDSVPPTRKRISTKDWHRLVRELRSMVLAIPGGGGGQGLFSTLQEAFRHPDGVHYNRLKLNCHVHAFLPDFRWLAQALASRPTRLTELMKQEPSTVGASDAAQHGMGGVHFLPTSDRLHASFVWRAPFPPNIQQRLVSHSNPNGTISNSDLELAGALVHQDVLAQMADIRKLTTLAFHDNTPAVYWQHKGSATTLGPAAYLLRMRAIHQLFHRYIAHQDYIPAKYVAALPADLAHGFRDDLSTIDHAVRAGIVPSRAAAADRQWERWIQFCESIHVDPWLTEHADPIPFLQIFAARYRDGRIAPSGRPVRSHTVEDALRAVGQTFARLRTHDIRKDSTGDIDFRLQRQLRSYTREDPTLMRIKPLPIQVVHHVMAAAATNQDPGHRAIANAITIAFFFLLRPGEYTGTISDNTPFRLADIRILLGTRHLDWQNASAAELQAATGVSYTFTSQKNGVCGEIFNHGCSGHTLACPVQATVRQVLHLR
ncbi:hypothetical protein ACA910_010599 [Epithemia clementina (nom. ined.)]